MLHDYAQYFSLLEEDTVFNKSLFLEKKKSYLKFCNEVLDTQLFQQFIQNVVNEGVGYFNKKIAQKENNQNINSLNIIKLHYIIFYFSIIFNSIFKYLIINE